MNLSPPRGTQDLVPPESQHFAALYDRASRLAELYGYGRVETPVFDQTELFARSSGATSDVVAKEMYVFEDRGGRSIALRPEGTAAVMRAYLNKAGELTSPFKAYYLERMYRYDRPQAGRYREHRQFGIEVIGAEEPDADTEVIVVGDAFLRELGLSQFELQINSLGDATCRPAYREELLAFLDANRERMTDEHRDRFRENPLRVLDCKDDACRAVAADAPKMIDRLCGPCREHFDGVLAGLEEEGVKAVLTPSLVRGLDYYTRTAFEFVSLSLTQAQTALFGGGRYDGLAEVLGGPATPGVGYGMGLERVLLALREEAVEPPITGGLDCYVVAFGEDPRRWAGHVAKRLRGAGLRTGRAFGDRSVKSQFKMADRSGAAFAVVVGQREFERGQVTIRRLADGEEQALDLAAAVEWIDEELRSAR
ncbi:MAG TPA: histidine--tRNA ligase [Actinomycetota bacterium]|nr:histidine--tRNA ligase [Actinomycetota bacterium]